MAQHDTSITAKLDGTEDLELPEIVGTKQRHPKGTTETSIHFDNGAKIVVRPCRGGNWEFGYGAIWPDGRLNTPTESFRSGDPKWEAKPGLTNEDGTRVTATEHVERRIQEYEEFDSIADAYRNWPVLLVDLLIDREFERREFDGQLYNHRHDPYEPNAKPW